MHTKISISSSTSALINGINAPIVEQVTEYNFVTAESQWVESYNKIKADGWPSCLTYNDFEKLPDNIKAECINEHQFSPTIWKDVIAKIVEDDYYVKDTICLDLEITKFLEKILPVLQNKSIVEFACRYGKYSLLLALNGCSPIVASDIRQDNLKIANVIKSDVKIDDATLQFTSCDIHNYTKLKELCVGKDVILFCGTLYHIHDHFNILQTFAKSTANHILIETQLPQHFDTELPIIEWRFVTALDSFNGYVEGMPDLVPEGLPNIPWIIMNMSLLGFKATHVERYTNRSHKRAIFLFERETNGRNV